MNGQSSGSGSERSAPLPSLSADGGDPGEVLLVVSDVPSRFDLLKAEAAPAGPRFVFCGKRDNVFSAVKLDRIRIVILDGESGREWDATLLHFIKTFDALIDVIIAGPPATSDQILDWIDKGATEYIPEPFRGGTLGEILGRIKRKRDLRRETYLLERELEKKYSFHGMVGKSPFMFEVFSQIEKIAGYFTTVLITGETGTGKELAARAIHALSPRREKKLVACDCVSIPESLFESELFGYERGAFTGADQSKKGLFEEADGGTLLLDEIGELPPAVQAKLLRFLESRQFRSLGSTETRTVDVRIVAATNRNLREEIKLGTFREDLLHRLSRIEISLPPLRHRLEDVPLLVRTFLEEFSAKFGKGVKGVSQQAQKALQTHPWRGNIRELKNVLESAFLMCQKDFIDLVDLPKNLQEDREAGSVKPGLPERRRVQTLDEAEKEHISFVLAATRNNLRRTAKLLDISRSTLYEKVKKYGISIR